MLISQATKEMLLEELEKPNADVQRIARLYGIPSRILRDLQGGEQEPATFAEKNGGFGRPELQQFIVSRTRAGASWPTSDSEAIEKARESYDKGFVEVCQGRDGNWIILYAIPRLMPDIGRQVYFSRIFSEG